MSLTAVVGYIRVSGEAEGSSLEAQRAKIEAYALALDLRLVAIDVDAGLGGTTLTRPGLAAALGRLERGEASCLLVSRLTRLTRSLADLGTLLEPNRFGDAWQLISIGDGIDTRRAAGRLVLNMMWSFSQWERANAEEAAVEDAARHH